MGEKIWKKLSFQVLTVVFCTFLPVNIVAIVVSGMILLKSTDQIRDSYQKELDTAMASFSFSLSEMEDRIDDFTRTYLTELTLAESNDNMVVYDMLTSLKDIYQVTGMEGLMYIVDRKTGQLYLKYSNSVYNAAEAESMKKDLINAGLPEGTVSEWDIGRLGERYFLTRYHQYTNYKVGFLVDINENLTKIFGDSLLQEGNLYIRNDDTLLYFSKEGLVATDSEKWENIFREGILKNNVYWPQNAKHPNVGMKIESNNYYGGTELLYWVLFVLSIGSFILVWLLWYMLQHKVMLPLDTLKTGMKELGQDHLEYRISGWPEDETEDFIYIYDAFNNMAREIGLSREKDIKMYQAELDNLKLQVNPHMLLNSLNMIYSLAQMKNYSCIQEFSLHLVDYFRYVLKENSSFVTLKKEMEFLKNYIEIQKIRFPDTFTCVYDIRPETEEALIPPLLVQNFVENAMKYALIPGEMIEILINIRSEDNKLLISICDTGRGIQPEVLECLKNGEMYTDKMGKKHIGVWNCRRRMELFYGKDTVMNIISDQGIGTQIWLELPLIMEDMEPVERKVTYEG